MGDGLEPRGKLDERGLAERGAQEADAHRHPEDVRGRHLDDRIAGSRGERRAREDEVVGHDEVGRPAGAVGGCDHRVDAELAHGRVDPLRAGVVVDLEGLVVGHAAEGWLRVVGRVGSARVHGLRELEDLLEEVRHLARGVRVVEGDRVSQRLVRHGDADACREVLLHVDLEVVEQDQEFAVRGCEREGSVEVHDGRARAADLRDRVVERGHHLGRSVVDALPGHADLGALESIRIEEHAVVSRKSRSSAAGALPTEWHARCRGIARVGCAADDGVEGCHRVGYRAGVRADRVLRVGDRHDAAAADDPDRRLDAHDGVDVRGTHDAAVGLAAEADRREVGGRGRRRA